ncbi:signal peptidase I [Dactylosporangium sp. NPDC051541]|uniref:signal peptidase I n=1 Tax=Dactylosporangium sp. NPDC051541 TaxID=3363977 RepID=UPI0037AD2C63
MRRLTSMALALVLASATGCSSGGSGNDSGNSSAPAETTEQFTQGGRSMEPGIKPGQVISARHVTNYTAKRGDVVLFHPPKDWTATGSPMLKRVLAVAGETIACCNTAGKITVDGVPLDEPYVATDGPLDAQPDPHTCGPRRFGPVKVPESSIFVVGDNRTASNDSRCVGSIPASAVFAVVTTGAGG